MFLDSALRREKLTWASWPAPEEIQVARLWVAVVVAAVVVAETVDVSLSGVLFQCAALGVEINVLVRVTLQVGDDEISLLGRLVRIRDVDAYAQELAVTFVNMDEARFALLQEFLEDVDPL